MRDIQIPIGPIGDMDVAIRSMRVGDLVNLHVRRQDIHHHLII